VTRLRVGFLQDAFEEGAYANQAADQATLATVRALGVDLVPMRLPTDLPVGALLTTLSVEAAAAFDTLTRERGIDTMVRQGENTWPNTFRAARFVPAVEHVQARRARTRLMEATHAAMADVDVFLSPSFGGGTLAITNLTGHPCVCLPNAFRPLEDAPPDSPRRQPGSITVVAHLYHDHHALALAHAIQQQTDFHRQRPPIK
jgi:Asp-tRNA(Asn)/Glu-tRNA(Gln) amidotransferase A subunit family amidase